jgi:2-dehydro-3-deoxyglucarate aldolase
MGKFESKKFKETINKILKICKKYKKLCGIHVVENNSELLKKRIKEGYKFIAYSTDAVILSSYKTNL